MQNLNAVQSSFPVKTEALLLILCIQMAVKGQVCVKKCKI